MSYKSRRLEAELAAAEDEHYVESLCPVCGHSRDDIVIEGAVVWICGRCEDKTIAEDSERCYSAGEDPLKLLDGHFTFRFDVSVPKPLEGVLGISVLPEHVASIRQAIIQAIRDNLGIVGDNNSFEATVRHNAVRTIDSGITYHEKIYVELD